MEALADAERYQRDQAEVHGGWRYATKPPVGNSPKFRFGKGNLRRYIYIYMHCLCFDFKIIMRPHIIVRDLISCSICSNLRPQSSPNDLV